jgi:hypothetical protein
MTEIPEHLRKRAEEARLKAEAAKAAAGGDGAAETTPPADAPAASAGGEAPPSEAASRIPAHLLERSRAARERAKAKAATEG